MKKLFLVLAAAFAMVACQTDINEVGVAGGEVDVTFEVGTPTRAYSDGKTATRLQYAIYDETGAELTSLTKTNETIDITATVELKLVTGNSYTAIFWADNDAAPYTVNFGAKTMTVNYTGETCNNENLDAFYAVHPFTVKGAQTETIELKRPFAQLNIGTADYAASTAAGYTPDQSYVKVTNIYNTLNLWDGTVSNEVAAEFAYADIKKDEVFPVGGYEYLAMNYLLVNEKETVDVEFAYKETSTGDAKTRVVGSVPVQRNYRTNIYGQLLTSDVDINVVIKPEYIEPAHTADALYLAAAVGGEITLEEDVVLTSALNVQSNMTIDLNGHNITINAAYDSNNAEASSAIVNNATLTLTGNGEIIATNNYTVRNKGTMIIDGVTVKNGIMNFGELTVESGNISNSRSGKHTIYGNAAKLTINGGTFHNENAGNAGIFAYGGEVVINGGEFTIADGTATFGWTSCLLDAQGGAKYTINGGVVRGEIRDYNKNTTIYGGAFSHYNSIKGFIAEGYVAKQNSENLWVVYKGAATEEALAEAISNGDEVVVLTGDITLAEALTIENTTATIDLNGKTLTAAETDGIVANAGANVTISGAGKVISNGAPIRAIGGKVVVEGGEFTQTGAFNTAISTYRYSVDSREGGEIIIKGGEFKTNNGMINVSPNSSVVVEGGSFLFDNNTKGTRHFAYISGTLTVKDGEFKGIADGGAGGEFFCGAASAGKVIIEGGKFTSLWTSGKVNSIWSVYASGASIEVKGGIFNHNGGIKAQVTENTDAATKDAYPYMAK